MTRLLVIFGIVFALFNNRYLKLASIASLTLSIFIVILGALGIIDKNGPLENVANEIISGFFQVPVEELNSFEGRKNNKD